MRLVDREADVLFIHKDQHSRSSREKSDGANRPTDLNVVSSVRVLGRKLDWLKLRDYLANADRGRELMEMVIYAGLPPPMPEWQSKRDKKSKFLHWLRSNGFLVVAKDGSPGDGKHYKANVDAGPDKRRFSQLHAMAYRFSKTASSVAPTGIFPRRAEPAGFARYRLARLPTDQSRIF